MSVVIIIWGLKLVSIYAPVVAMLIIILVLKLTLQCKKFHKEDVNNWQAPIVEAGALGLFTITNLENTKSSRLCRKLTTYIVFIFHTLNLGTIVILPKVLNNLEETKPDLVEMMPFLQNLPHIDPIIYGTLAVGFLSLLIDWSFRWQPIFHESHESTFSKS